MKDLEIVVYGATRNERIRIIDLLRETLILDDVYKSAGGNYPLEGGVSTEKFSKINTDNIYKDMTVSACMGRYDLSRDRIIDLIKQGSVSASMSGIENYPYPSIDLEIARDLHSIKNILTWNGETHLVRLSWEDDFNKWRKTTGEGE